ncbi:hypothetical protein Tco_0294562 [Tanacetum coccineum]
MSRRQRWRRARMFFYEDEDACRGFFPNKEDDSLIIYDLPLPVYQLPLPVTSISTVSPLRVSTAEDISGAETLVYIRRSASKAKDIKKSSLCPRIWSQPEENQEARFKAEQEQERIDFVTALEFAKKRSWMIEREVAAQRSL